MAAPSSGPILIIDDNRDTREVLQRILGISGYAFVSVGDADAALRYLGGRDPVAAIILDMHLPGTDGRAFLDALKTNPDWTGIPVIVFSVEPGNVRDVAACVQKGRDDPDVLLDAIAACVRR